MEYDPGETLLQAIADELAKKAMDCNPQNVANSVWALGVLGALSNHCRAQIKIAQCQGFEWCLLKQGLCPYTNQPQPCSW